MCIRVYMHARIRVYSVPTITGDSYDVVGARSARLSSPHSLFSGVATHPYAFNLTFCVIFASECILVYAYTSVIFFSASSVIQTIKVLKRFYDFLSIFILCTLLYLKISLNGQVIYIPTCRLIQV